MRVGGQSVGLLVDRAEGFVTPAALNPLQSADTLNGCATAVFAHHDGVGWLIEPARLLGEAERKILAASTAEAARRLAEWTSAT